MQERTNRICLKASSFDLTFYTILVLGSARNATLIFLLCKLSSRKILISSMANQCISINLFAVRLESEEKQTKEERTKKELTMLTITFALKTEQKILKISLIVNVFIFRPNLIRKR